MSPKKIPMRMCVGCREMHPKKELLRIVRTVDGKTVADPTSKVSGRGAYICPNQECFLKARKIRGIERALEVEISDEVFESLRKGIESDT